MGSNRTGDLAGRWTVAIGSTSIERLTPLSGSQASWRYELRSLHGTQLSPLLKDYRISSQPFI